MNRHKQSPPREIRGAGAAAPAVANREDGHKGQGSRVLLEEAVDKLAEATAHAEETSAKKKKKKKAAAARAREDGGCMSQVM